MPTQPRKISKENGVQMCVDLLFSGQVTGDIIRKFKDEYGLSTSTVEKWLREARPQVEIRRTEAENIRRRESEAAIAEHARKSNITREAAVDRLWAIFNGNLQDFLSKNNNVVSVKDLPREVAGLLASIEVEELYRGSPGNRYWVGQVKKIKLLDPLKAMDMINKMNGWYKETEQAPIHVHIGYGKEVPV